MTTDFLEKLIPQGVEGRDEIIRKIFAEYGKGVNAEKTKYGDYDSVKEQLTRAQETIAGLEKNKGDVASLQAKIEEYKAADAQRAKDAEAKRVHDAIEARFSAITGDKKFVHEYVRQGVLNEFENAVKATENAGKGDKEIFDALTKDKDYFASMNPPAQMGGMGESGGADGVTAEFLRRNPDLKGLI